MLLFIHAWVHGERQGGFPVCDRSNKWLHLIGEDIDGTRPKNLFVQVEVIEVRPKLLRIHNTRNHILIDEPEVINDGMVIVDHSSRHDVPKLDLAQLHPE